MEVVEKEQLLNFLDDIIYQLDLMYDNGHRENIPSKTARYIKEQILQMFEANKVLESLKSEGDR